MRSTGEYERKTQPIVRKQKEARLLSENSQMDILEPKRRGILKTMI